MDIRKEISRRLRTRRQELGLSAVEVSARMPSHPSGPRYNHWEKRGTLPKMEQLIELAQALKVSPSYLCGFTEDMRDREADERQFLALEDAHISLPSGDMVRLPTDRSLQFNRDDLKERGLKPERLILLRVGDQSMAPIVCEGDRVLVNCDQRVPEVRDIFAMLVRNKVWFRWICPELDGSFTVTGEDSEQQRETRIEATALDSLCIIGRVTKISRYR